MEELLLEESGCWGIGLQLYGNFEEMLFYLEYGLGISKYLESGKNQKE